MQGKVVAITGAARGQGRSHAVRLAEEGADILAVDICAQIDTVGYPMATEEDLAETARLVAKLGHRVLTRVADVRERSQLAAAVRAAVEQFGRLDVVVANAGISPLGAQYGVAAFVDALSVNLVGMINTVEAALPHLRAGASVICIGSMASYLPGTVDSPAAGPGGAGYSHSKRPVARLVHDLAHQLAPQPIRVNAVHPGNIDTDMLQNEMMYRMFRPDLEHPTREDPLPAIGAMHRMPVQVINPVDISEAVLFLASDASRYVTGQQMKVDAGALLAQTTSGTPG